MKEEIQKHLAAIDLDIRKNGNGRFMDQKCLPDVMTAVAECILAYCNQQVTIPFDKNKIWHSEFSNQLIQEVFSKPDLENNSTTSEYDKLFAQPLKLLAAAQVLHEEQGSAGENVYTIQNLDLLKYIAGRERNALIFLDEYLNRVIEQSGLSESFEAFFAKQDNSALNTLRIQLNNFYHQYTNIKNDFEPPRIYNKIINILAFRRKLKGTSFGRVTSSFVTFDDIRYNRKNWRDLTKDKNMSRQEYANLVQNEINKNPSYYRREIEKAKQIVRDIEPYSEIHRFQAYPGTQAHHIFMAREYPDLADFPENIICLTPNQHFLKAHPENSTYMIDKDYQIVCLLSKLDSIEINLRSGKDNYSFEDFIHVLNVGLDTDTFNSQMNYEDVKYLIMKEAYYQPKV